MANNSRNGNMSVLPTDITAPNSKSVSSLEILQGTYSAAPFGMNESMAGRSFVQNINPVFGTLFTIMTKKGVVYMSGTTDGAGNWRPDYEDVGSSSTNEELQFAFMNIFTDSDILPTTINDYATAQRVYPTAGAYSWILSPAKALCVCFTLIRKDRLKSTGFSVRMTNRFGSAPNEVIEVEKSFASSVADNAFFCVPVANFAPRLSQSVTVALDSDTFKVVEDTQTLIGVVDPATLIKADGTTIGNSMEVKGDNLDVYITVIPYTVGNVAGFIDYASRARNTNFKG